jgi:ferredoxin
MNGDGNCSKEEADLFRLHNDVPCEGTGCCRTMTPQLFSPQTIHYTNEDFRVLQRMHLYIYECIEI